MANSYHVSRTAFDRNLLLWIPFFFIQYNLKDSHPGSPTFPLYLPSPTNFLTQTLSSTLKNYLKIDSDVQCSRELPLADSGQSLTRGLRRVSWECTSPAKASSVHALNQISVSQSLKWEPRSQCGHSVQEVCADTAPFSLMVWPLSIHLHEWWVLC